MAKRQQIANTRLKLESKSLHTQILDLLFNRLKTSTKQQVRGCDRT